MATVRRKPIEYDAHRMGKRSDDRSDWPAWLSVAHERERFRYTDEDKLEVLTKEGGHLGATSGYWIVMGMEGEIWPVAHHIFEASYEVIG